MPKNEQVPDWVWVLPTYNLLLRALAEACEHDQKVAQKILDGMHILGDEYFPLVRAAENSDAVADTDESRR